ncbi:MAG: acetylglutamate kinase, partial [archaeon]
MIYTQKIEPSIYFQKVGIPLNEGITNLNKILDMRVLIKIGGDCLNNGGYESIGKNLADLYALGIIPAIVHGGSSQIDKIMEEKGMQIIKVNGLRAVPDEDTLDAVVEGLKEVNKGLVSTINKYAGSKIAVGLTEEKIIYAKKIENAVNLGFVGEVTGIDTDKIDSYLKKRKIPVLWCIGYGKDGQQYNINADMVGENLAHEYNKYILLTSVGGYIQDGKIVPEMNLEQAKKHNASGGMSVKLDSIIR